MLAEFPTVYGLRVRADNALPGLAGNFPSGQPDVQLWLRDLPGWLQKLTSGPADTKYTSPDLDDEDRPSFIVFGHSGGEYFRLCFSDGAEFIADRTGTRVWADWPDTLTLEDISTYLFGAVMGWVLRLRGVVCLHASAVAVDGRAVAFVGPSGAGKSTTAAALSHRGLPVLADDIVAIDERGQQFVVPPGYPGLRLCPQSVAALFGSQDALPSLAPGWGKHLLDLSQNPGRFQHTPLALAGIYILRHDPRGSGKCVKTLSKRAALLSLLTNTHAGRLLNPVARGQEFELLARLVARVPVWEIFQGRELALLPQLCDTILAHLELARVGRPTVTSADR